MVRVLKTFYRKGKNNRKFVHIVETVLKCLQKTREYHFDKDLLKFLRSYDKGFEGLDIPVFRQHKYAYDIYHRKKKIAIEIEKSETKLAWKILCKFIIGSRKKLVNYAIVIVPTVYRGRGKSYTNNFNDVKRASEFISDILWTRNLAIIGYDRRLVK